jgi:Icc-related predicted phosphoesterase
MRHTRVFFITDIHGSDLCFRKFLNSFRSAKNPDVIIIGGDITGKWLVPLVGQRGGNRIARFEGTTVELQSEKEILDYEKRLADTGAYALRCNQDTADELERDPDAAEAALKCARVERLSRWIDLADKVAARTGRRIVINAGNDDPYYVDGVLRSAQHVVMPEGQVVPVDSDINMLSTGYANHTPWPCARM